MKSIGRIVNIGPLLLLLLVSTFSVTVFAHDVATGDKSFVQSIEGVAFFPFLYLGAKHMVTGYDHILFLIGVIFYLFKLKDVVVYVSLFTLGHSITLLLGVLLDTGANSHLVDAIIGLSVVYKGLENVGALQKLGIRINAKFAVLSFGLFHGLGLATKLQDLAVSENGLLTNLLAFNLGVEVGQIIALFFVVMLLSIYREFKSFTRTAVYVNFLLIVAGSWLTYFQFYEYLQS